MRQRIRQSIRLKATLSTIAILGFSCVIACLAVGGFYRLAFGSGAALTGGRLAGLLVAVCALCIGIGGGLLFFAAKRLTDPIEALSRAAAKVAKGEFELVLEAKSSDELGVLTENFTIMAAELSNMEYLRKDFVSSVSHEFKTPLASIQGFVELLQERELTEESRRQYLRIIAEEIDRLSRLSSNLLRLSQLDNRTLPDPPVHYRLDEQLRTCMVLLEEQWTSKGLIPELELEPLVYYGDEPLLQQIWLNLIDAIKFSPAGGALYLALRRSEMTVTVIVGDEGIGISPEQGERIFERFYQADTSRKQQGSGLGLAIVKRIVELCRGSIRFDSEPGQGTAFRVELPASGADSGECRCLWALLTGFRDGSGRQLHLLLS
jgi:signal transduction histidine kinase